MIVKDRQSLLEAGNVSAIDLDRGYLPITIH